MAISASKNFRSIIFLLLVGLAAAPGVRAAEDISLVSRLRGYILLQVESRGEAWYVAPDDDQRIYLPDGSSAYSLMRSLSLGITDKDLDLIPVGLYDGPDTDGDGAADLLEKALGTDPRKADSDNDGYPDGTEIRSGYSPLNKEKIVTSQGLVNRLRGRILLQTERLGQAWYLNPANGRRYYLADGNAAYSLMRGLSLGIRNADLQKININNSRTAITPENKTSGRSPENISPATPETPAAAGQATSSPAATNNNQTGGSTASGGGGGGGGGGSSSGGGSGNNPVVQNTGPQITITAPSDGYSILAGNDIDIAADASDTDGQVMKVEFYSGTAKIGEDAAAPFSFRWENITAGSYEITARAYDDDGAFTSTVAVHLAVTAPQPPVNVPPTVSITSPLNGTTATAGSDLTISAAASDPDGSVTKVEFYNGSTKIGEDSSSPYTYTWLAISAGSYSFTARALDNAGTTTVSSAAAVSVTAATPPAPNQVPSVTITSPDNWTEHITGLPLRIILKTADSDGTIAKAEFFRDGIKIGETAATPFVFDWSSPSAGYHEISARVTDDDGAKTTSGIKNVTVRAAVPSPSLPLGISPYGTQSWEDWGGYLYDGMIVHSVRNRVQVIANPDADTANSSPHVAKFSIRYSDDFSGVGGNGSPRAEIAAGPNLLSYEGHVFRTSWKTYIPEGFPTDYDRTNQAMDFHQVYSGKHLNIQGPNYRMEAQDANRTYHFTLIGSWAGDVGRWVQWEEEMYLSRANGGSTYYRLKKDGVTVYSDTWATLGYDAVSAGEAYLKWGLYKPDWKNANTLFTGTIEMYVDDVQITDVTDGWSTRTVNFDLPGLQ